MATQLIPFNDFINDFWCFYSLEEVSVKCPFQNAHFLTGINTQNIGPNLSMAE
jgi:hypothetical protein